MGLSLSTKVMMSQNAKGFPTQNLSINQSVSPGVL